MTPSDLAFAQACVRGLRIVVGAAQEWVRNKAIEMAEKKPESQLKDHSQQRPRD